MAQRFRGNITVQLGFYAGLLVAGVLGFLIWNILFNHPPKSILDAVHRPIEIGAPTQKSVESQSALTNSSPASSRTEPHSAPLVSSNQLPRPLVRCPGTNGQLSDANPGAGTPPIPIAATVLSNQPPPSVDAVRPVDPPNSPIPDEWLKYAPPVTNTLLAQIALSGYGISVGSIDGVPGVQTEMGLRAFQMDRGLETTGRLDSETEQLLKLRHPPFIRRPVSPSDWARLRPVPATWIGKASVDRLDFATLLELLGEWSHSNPSAIIRWNSTVHFEHPVDHLQVLLPSAEYPQPRRAALVRISLGNQWIRAFSDQGALLAHFPCSIGRIAEKRPVGELHVARVAKDPNYTFDPAVFPESREAQEIGHKLILPPGPNNPVGVAWIGLDRAGYGIHGTPSPEQVGRTESHGCFRLANWNADYLRRMVRVGTPVWIEP